MSMFAVHIQDPSGFNICWIVCGQGAEPASRHVLNHLANPGSTVLEVTDFSQPVDEIYTAETLVWLEEENP